MATPFETYQCGDPYQGLKDTLLKHHYEFREQIGEGGYGTVFLVWSTKYEELFVCKKIPVKTSCRVTSEVEVLMNLQHPNIINMYEYWLDDNNLYIILEYCQNGSLKDVLKVSGPLNPKQLCHACKDIAAAIEFCHANNIVHRDIKPANLLIDKYNRIKLCDFGLSTQATANVQARSGSLAYMCPEALLGRPNIDQFMCDIWALGVTFFELATGVLPWTSRTFTEMRQEILFGLQKRPKFPEYSFYKLLKQMMEVDPANRLTITEVLKSEFFAAKEVKSSRDIPKPLRHHTNREPKLLTSPQITNTFSTGVEKFPTTVARKPGADALTRQDPKQLQRSGMFLSLMMGNRASSMGLISPVKNISKAPASRISIDGLAARCNQ